MFKNIVKLMLLGTGIGVLVFCVYFTFRKTYVDIPRRRHHV